MIRRVLIANRGEVAVRIARACRELGIESVAVYSEPDAKALHVTVADRAVPIGPAAAAESYLSVARILEAARRADADAVHPGYGFLSENAAFAEACERAGLTFIGPPASVIARMGSKIEARRLMESAGVPVVPGETPSDQSDEGLRRAIGRVGFPALIKASAGGGGRGMRIVRELSEIDDAVPSARRESLAAFGDGTLYVERYIARARHVEVQVMGDATGRVTHLFERDCSVQRRHQKVIEESPSPGLTIEGRTRIAEAGVTAAAAASYVNAGTIEFLVDASSDPKAPAFYFLEMNTRLQVEHPVTEAVTGVDIVHAQLRVAAGEPLPWTGPLTQRGHAIEARIYAEDPRRGFLPQAGRLLLYRQPSLPGVRIDAGVMEGDDIPVHYDPLLAKVIATGDSRDAALARLVAALRAFPILGVRTNLPFLIHVLKHPRFRAGEVDTGFLDAEPSIAVQDDPEPPAFVRAAIDAAADLTTPAAAAASRHAWDPWRQLRAWRG